MRARVPLALLIGAFAAAAPAAAAALDERLVHNPIRADHRVDHVAVGFGAVWGLGGRSLTQFDAARLRVRRTAPRFPAPGADVAAGPDALWVRTQRALWRVDPTTLERVKVADVSGAGTIAVDGNRVWYSVDGEAVIARLDQQGGAPAGVEVTLPEPVSAMAIADGVVWAGSARTSTLWKLDGDSGALLETIVLIQEAPDPATVGTSSLAQVAAQPARRPTFQVAAGGNKVWVSVGAPGTFRDNQPALVGVDAATGEVVSTEPDGFVEFSASVSEPEPRGLALTADAVWYARADLDTHAGAFLGPSAVARTDPATGRFRAGPANRLSWIPEDRVREPGVPRDLAADGDVAWLARSPGVVRVSTDGPAARTSTVPGITGIAVARNRVWALTGRGLQRVGRTTGKPVGRLVRLRGNRLIGQGRWLWLESPDGRQVRRIDPRSGRVRQITPLPKIDDLRDTQLAITGSGILRSRYDGRNEVLSGFRLGSGRRLYPPRKLPPGEVGDLALASLATRGNEVWIATDAVRRLDRNGRVTRRIPLQIPAFLSPESFSPRDIAIGRRHVWVADTDEGLVRYRKAGRGARTTKTGTFPVSIALAGRDAWVVAVDSNSLHRVDQRTGREQLPAIGLPDATQFTEIVAGAGSLWITELAEPNTLARVPLSSFLPRPPPR